MRKLKRSECAVLRLVLKKRWYDMIASGEKREEYRDCKPYWANRLRKWVMAGYCLDYLVVAFSCGYTKPTMFHICRGCVYSWKGKYRYHEWGEPDTPHFVIALGKRVELED